MLAQRLSDIHTARCEEGVRHATADDEVINLAQEVPEHGELGRDLRAADDGGDRALWIAERALKRLEFRFHRSAGEARQVMCDALRGGVCAVGDRKGVVDIEITEGRHAPREFGIVLFFAEMESRALKDADVARQHGRDGPLRFRSLAVFDESYRSAS